MNRKEYNRKWRAANPEKVKEASRKYRAENPEKVRAAVRKWQVANPERSREATRKWRVAHPERAREDKRKFHENNPEYDRKWRAKNPEKVKEASRKFREKNPAYGREWKAKNPEKVTQQRIKWRAENPERVSEQRKKDMKTFHAKNRDDPIYKMHQNMRSSMSNALQGRHKSAPTMKIIGCTVEGLFEHLESCLSWEPWMTREKYGAGGWDVDHIIAISKWDGNCPLQFVLCWEKSNLQPLEHIANIKKGGR